MRFTLKSVRPAPDGKDGNCNVGAEWWPFTGTKQIRGMILPNDGIPSYDTFTRVFARLDPEQFQTCFVRWIAAVSQRMGGQVIAIDGKVLRRSHDHGIGQAAIDMVSAWAAANRLVLGQVKVVEKSNEITAIPRLLEALEVAGCIVTIDARGCQTEIAHAIVGQEADYVLALKDNQGICSKMSTC